MDFFAVARQARGGVGENFDHTAADVVGGANLSATFSGKYTEGVNKGSELAAEVIALARGVTCSQHRSRPSSHHEPAIMGTATQGERARRWRIFDAGLEEIQARLAHNKIPSGVFQDQLISSWRYQDLWNKVQINRDASPWNGSDDPKYDLGNPTCAVINQEWRNGWSPRPLCVLWRLHDSGLLPLFRLLEASEMASSPFDARFRGSVEGHSDSLEEHFEDFTDTIVRGVRELAREFAENDDRLGHGRHRDSEASSPLLDIAQHLFDIAYRKPPDDSGPLVGGKQSGETLSTRAARRVLDRLCCGKELFGRPFSSRKTDRDLETRLRGCAAIFSAIDPLLLPCASAESYGAMGVEGGLDNNRALIASLANLGKGAPETVNAAVPRDEPTVAFLERQLRVLLDNASGLSGLIDREEASAFEAEMSAGRGSRVLVDIMRHFCPVLLIDTLRSICRRIISMASDATGPFLLKPLLQWDSLGPIVRAAASVHTQSVPLAVAAIGTELAGEAVNIVPVGDSDAARASVCTQDQGVLILSAALRLVAQADRRSHSAPCATLNDGLYTQWMHSCFGVTATAGDSGTTQKVDDVVVEHSLPRGREEQAKALDTSQAQYPEVVRLAMEKQGAFEVLMRALCLSVPYDQAFVLEVHRDVLKSRLRANFSIQVRDYLDLVETRLSDLKVQEKGGGRSAARRTHDDSHREVRSGRLSGDDGDPTRREKCGPAGSGSCLYHGVAGVHLQIGFFLRQFKQTGQVPSALKTAILWQPKSWTKYRKVLLASPGERIAIPDDRGIIAPESDGDVKETISHGEKGLRVEVSLKYRRLLVQQLAKDKLLSAKDHEAFRQSYVEFLHGQRDRDAAKRNENKQESEPLTDTTKQLLLLESRMGEKQHNRGRDSDSIPETKATKGDVASVQHKLALLLQEYLPRALIVELCIEDDDESCRVPSKAPTEAMRSSERVSGRNWFRRATDFLTGILREWERRFKRGAPQVDPSSWARSRDVPVSESAHTDVTPQVVAEAILNSIHCCIAAVGISLGQDLLTPLSTEPESLSQPRTSAGDKEQGPIEWRKAGRGSMQNEKPHAGSVSGTHVTATGLRVDEAVKTLRLIGRLVASAAEVDAVGTALCERCFNLLSNPSRLDVKQIISLAHVVASLPSILHPQVEDLWTDLIGETLQCTPVDGAGHRWEVAEHVKKHKKGGMGLMALAQIVALYLQSTLLLHHQLATCTSKGVDDDSYRDSNGDDTPRWSKTSGNGRGGGHSASSLDTQSVGCAPVILLDLAWWMERRLTNARCRNELPPVVGLAMLSQLLRNVIDHPMIKRSFARTFAKGGAKPPLERVIALEVAVSRIEDVIAASTKLSFLESVILDQVPMKSLYGPEHAVMSDGQESARHCSTSTKLSASSDDVKDARDIWKGCVTVLVENSSLRDAAHRRVYRDQALHDLNSGISFKSCGRSLKSAHEDPECTSSSGRKRGRSGGIDGVQTLLSCILDVMRNLCALEATAGSIFWLSVPKTSLKKSGCGQGEGWTGQRGVSMLLTEAIAILNSASATRECAVSSVLILIAEVAIPIIGATEGPSKAIELLHLTWQEWFCRTRSLEYGVVLRLTRMSFMFHGGRRCVTGEGSGELQNCWVVRMLENFPSLTVEMVRFWPSLARTLQPLINLADSSSNTRHRERDDWFAHLSILHIAGKELVQRLAGGDLGTPVSAERSSGSEVPARHPRTGSDGGEPRLRRDDGRVRLGHMRSGPQGQMSVSDQSRPGEKVDWQEDRVYARDVHAGSKAQLTVLRTAELVQSPSRYAAKALPRSLSMVIVDAVDAAAAILVEATKKRPHQELASVTVGAKRNKSAVAARGHGSGDVPELSHVHQADKGAPQSFRSGHRNIKPTQWVAGLLMPLFGVASEKCELSSLTTLLETVVDALGTRKTDDNDRRKDFEGDDSNDVAQSLKKSLVIGILEYAPSLVTRIAEAPFLASSGQLVARTERLRRSLALLDCLKGLPEEVLRQYTAESATWLTAVLSHYGAALLSMASVSNTDSAVENIALERIKGRKWEELVDFVHAQIRGISRRQLRLIPAAVALQEVDPLLKQYF